MSEHPFEEVAARMGEQVDEDARRFAAAALGVPDDTRIVPMDLSKAAMALIIEPSGLCTVSCNIPKPEAARLLRHLADKWDPQP